MIGYLEPLYGVGKTVTGRRPSDLDAGREQDALTNVRIASVGRRAHAGQPRPDRRSAPRPERAFVPRYANDIIYGGLGNDAIHGGAGDDAISGGEALARRVREQLRDRQDDQLNLRPRSRPTSTIRTTLATSSATAPTLTYQGAVRPERSVPPPDHRSTRDGSLNQDRERRAAWLLNFDPNDGPLDGYWAAAAGLPDCGADGRQRHASSAISATTGRSVGPGATHVWRLGQRLSERR